VNHVVNMQPVFVGVGNDLLCRNDIAQCTDRIGSATRDQIGCFAGSAQTFACRDQFPVHVEASRPGFDDSPENLVEQHISVRVVIRWCAADALFQQNGRLESVLVGRRYRLADMVGLGGSLGEDMCGALRQCIADQELQLARLVAAQCQAGIVIALDVDVRAIEKAGQVAQELQWRWRLGQADARK
jgi:hypothetical protein